MRYSKQRQKIIDIVCQTDSHPSADWIYAHARKILPNISLGTVYRNLNQLVENNILNTIRIENILHYDGNLQNHHHFICNDCSTVYDIEMKNDFIDSNLKIMDHEISDFKIKMRGICKICSELTNKRGENNVSN